MTWPRQIAWQMPETFEMNLALKVINFLSNSLAQITTLLSNHIVLYSCFVLCER